jgi:flagellar motor switch/type III secretory pathway protein FliN
MCVFQLGIYPDSGSIILAVSRSFLREVLSRLIRDNISDLVESDFGLFEFLVVSILERANRDLKYPFQCHLIPGRPSVSEDETGTALEAIVRLAKAEGCVQLFLSDRSSRKVQGNAKTQLPSELRTQLTWDLSLRLGFVDVSQAELSDLEPEDILIYTAEEELILPSVDPWRLPERGWRLSRNGNSAHRYEVKDFFERSVSMEDSVDLLDDRAEDLRGDEEPTSQVGLKELPIRIHVVLSQVELSLRDLEGLVEGSVIELNREQSGSVQLVSNGRVLGAGEIVEVDDHLGIQITRWQKK